MATSLQAQRQTIIQEPGEPLSMQISVEQDGTPMDLAEVALRLDLFGREGEREPVSGLTYTAVTGSGVGLFVVSGNDMARLGTGNRWFEVSGLIGGARHRLLLGPLVLSRGGAFAVGTEPAHYQVTIGPLIGVSVTVQPWVTTITGNIPNFLDLPLLIEQPGQTVWNIGGNEIRHHLYVNGVRLVRNKDYTINLPYLNYPGGAILDSSDDLVLTLL